MANGGVFSSVSGGFDLAAFNFAGGGVRLAIRVVSAEVFAGVWQ